MTREILKQRLKKIAELRNDSNALLDYSDGLMSVYFPGINYTFITKITVDVLTNEENFDISNDSDVQVDLKIEFNEEKVDIEEIGALVSSVQSAEKLLWEANNIIYAEE